MSDKMQPVQFGKLLEWIFQEYARRQEIFGIHSTKFYRVNKQSKRSILGEALELPLGPAAGPHTQLAQNIISAYLAGGRFFELKTVQKLDRLEIDKPCIDARDEGYNVEWSQELTLEQSYAEYVKAWLVLHVLKAAFGLSDTGERGFVFNMSVGYDLEGIKTPAMNDFIDGLMDASENKTFFSLKTQLLAFLQGDIFLQFLTDSNEDRKITAEQMQDVADKISPRISGSVTLSTMHGCPPQEIESICKYLISEKQLHTYVKLNPTLLGYGDVNKILSDLGYRYMQLDEESFSHDLQFEDAVPMLKRLREFAGKHSREFGIKLSNTLGMNNHARQLPAEQMYMSGRSLFPLTINLAHRLASALDGDIRISYSGGADAHNIADILATGISPVTLVTDLLKPGGYSRLHQMAELVDNSWNSDSVPFGKIDLELLKEIALKSLLDIHYRKEKREIDTIKIPKKLPQFDCYISPCQEACPIHQDVAEYIGLVEEGRFAEAFEVIVSKNPLPHITGYICDHQCMNHCTRWDYDDPVLIRDMKKEAAEQGFELYLKNFRKPAASGKKQARAAIIGAGPSGLAAANFLAKAGLDVTVFEQTDRAGGTVQHVIPGFRLPQSAIDRDIEFVKQHGVKFQFGTDGSFSVQQLKAEGFKYIYIAIGAPLSNALRISNAENIYDAIEFLAAFNHKESPRLGKQVAVIGGGNSAMDGARAALRCEGVEQVSIIYRRTKEFMPADREEFDAAVNEGVRFRELLLPVEFRDGVLKCQKMALGEMGVDGRRKVVPIENAFEDFPVNTVISAIGEHVDLDILQKNLLIANGDNSIRVTEDSNETLLENVFIGGDALRGPSTVVESIADGKKAAEAIIRKEGVSTGPPPDLNRLFDNQKRISELRRKRGYILPEEAENSRREASRCLTCNLVCNKCVEVCPNRANVAIPLSGNGSQFSDMFQILHLDGLCNECGNCETFCPYSGSPYKDKITLFWNEVDFEGSSNDGFFLKKATPEGKYAFRVRFNKQVGDVIFDPAKNIAKLTLDKKIHQRESKDFLELIKAVVRDYSYLL